MYKPLKTQVQCSFLILHANTTELFVRVNECWNKPYQCRDYDYWVQTIEQKLFKSEFLQQYGTIDEFEEVAKDVDVEVIQQNFSPDILEETSHHDITTRLSDITTSIIPPTTQFQDNDFHKDGPSQNTRSMAILHNAIREDNPSPAEEIS
jgi:hypothetical protein